MKTPNDQDPGDSPIRFEYCQRAIPPDAALTVEGDEYIRHFCGDACHAAWEEEVAGEVRRAYRARSGSKEPGR
jgi:hypothetical protein